MDDGQMYRFYCDVESKNPNDLIDVNKIIARLQQFVNNVFKINAQFISVQSDDKSNRFHIYGSNFACTIETMKQITQSLDSPYIDTQVYRNGASLRICNSYKCDSKTDITNWKMIKKTYSVTDRQQFLKTIVNYTDDCLILTDNIGLTSKSHYLIPNNQFLGFNKKSQNKNGIIDNKNNGIISREILIEQVRQYLINNGIQESSFSITPNPKNQFGHFITVNGQYTCPNNKTEIFKHSSNNMYTNYFDGKHYLICHAESCKKARSVIYENNGIIEHKEDEPNNIKS